MGSRSRLEKPQGASAPPEPASFMSQGMDQMLGTTSSLNSLPANFNPASSARPMNINSGANNNLLSTTEAIPTSGSNLPANFNPAFSARPMNINMPTGMPTMQPSQPSGGPGTWKQQGQPVASLQPSQPSGGPGGGVMSSGMPTMQPAQPNMSTGMPMSINSGEDYALDYGTPDPSTEFKAPSIAKPDDIPTLSGPPGLAGGKCPTCGK